MFPLNKDIERQFWTTNNPLTGQDYDIGELEALQDGVDNSHSTIKKILQLLVVKNLIDISEAVKVLSKYRGGENSND